MKNLALPILFGIFCSFELIGCGVKGKPLPPLTPPLLGRGEPNYSKATQDVKIRPQSSKKRKADDDDWDNDDFAPEKQK